MRTTSSNLIMKSLIQFNNRIRKIAEKIFNFTINDNIWRHISLTISNGGLGIRDPTRLCHVAYLSSRISYFPTIDDNVNDVLNQINQLIPSLNLVWNENNNNILSQSELSKLIDEYDKSTVLNQLDDMVKIAFLSYTQPFASAWLSARPLKAEGLYLKDQEFITAVKLRLGIPLFNNQPCICNQKLDQFGYHALTCKIRTDTVSRHNNLRDIIYNQSRIAGLKPVKEKPGLVYKSKQRPADIFLPEVNNESDYWIDVAITDPRQPKFKLKSISTPGSAAEAYALIKREKYGHLIKEHAKFKPVIVETFGAWSKESHEIIELIARKDNERGVISFSYRKNLLHQKISISIQRNNSKSILSKQRLHNNFNENNENIETNKYLINDKPEAIETKNLKINHQSSLKSNNNNIKPREKIVNSLPSSIKIKSKRKNNNSPYKSNHNPTLKWNLRSTKPIVNFIIDSIPNIEILKLQK